MSNDFNKNLAKNIAEEMVGKAYDDLARPGFKATGKVLSLIPRTIRIFFGKWEKWILNGEYTLRETEKILEEKLKHIPEEKIVEPEPYVAVPAMQQLSYSFDSNELRELYANLLASSMNIDTKMKVHPAFVDIIKQLSPMDAQGLERIKKLDILIPVIAIEMRYENDSFTEIISDYAIALKDIYGDLSLMRASLKNLDRLGLVHVRYDQFVKPDERYEDFKSDEVYRNLIKVNPNTEERKIRIQRGLIELTEFGKQFCEICCNGASIEI